MSVDMDTTSPRPIVYYDGGCPLCAREIAFWRGRRGAERFDGIDVADLPADAEVSSDLRVCDAMARFHVRRADGSLVDGAKAFLELWKALPLTRPIAWFLSIPPGPGILEAAYRVFLAHRGRFGGRAGLPGA